MLDVIGARFSPSVSGTLRAMLLDNRYFLDPRAAEQLRTAGTFHVISISGMHVGIIAWLLLGGASKVSRRSRTWIVVVMVVVWAYALMVGLAPPVTRASVMISIGLIGPMLFRRAASMNTVSLAAFVMLAFRPSLVEDPAFQLSFLAVAGIFGLAMPIINKLRAIGEWRPSPHSPRPPSCHRITRAIAETLFWDSRSFHQEMRNSPVSFMLDKSRAPALLTALRLQRMLRIIVTLALTSVAI